MRVNGYMLREAIQSHRLAFDSSNGAFSDSFKKFDGEDKPHPTKLAGEKMDAEVAMVLLEEAQAKYNLAVTVKFEGKDITLLRAIKLLGGYARAEKAWRTKVKSEERRSYYDRDDKREAGTEYAKDVMTREEIVEKARQAAKCAGALRTAIGNGNSMHVEIEIDQALFE